MHTHWFLPTESVKPTRPQPQAPEQHSNNSGPTPDQVCFLLLMLLMQRKGLTASVWLSCNSLGRVTVRKSGTSGVVTAQTQNTPYTWSTRSNSNSFSLREIAPACLTQISRTGHDRTGPSWYGTAPSTLTANLWSWLSTMRRRFTTLRFVLSRTLANTPWGRNNARIM